MWEAGVYHRVWEKSVKITLQYANETHNVKNEHNHIIFVGKNGKAAKFHNDKIWFADSVTTNGYDPGNTGYGYNEVVSHKENNDFRILDEKTFAKENIEDYTKKDELTISWKAKDYSKLKQFIGTQNDLTDNVSINEETLKNYPDIPGIYLRKIDQKAPGDDVNEEVTKITIHSDCSAFYEWEKNYQGGSSLPTKSTDKKEGKLVTAHYSTKCEISVNMKNDGSMTIEEPPLLALSFDWKNQGYTDRFDLSQFDKQK